MVVGYGFKYGRGRCYTLWMDFMACAEKHRSYGAGVCLTEREDYMECLHHTKLVSCQNAPVHLSLQLYTFIPHSFLIHSLLVFQAARLDTVKDRKKKLIEEGKWPPK